MGLHLLGAHRIGLDGLKNQLVTLRVLRVDEPTFRQKVKDTLFSNLGLVAADHLPKAAIDVGLILAEKRLKEYGIEAKLTAANSPLVEGARPVSEFFPGLVAGAAVGAALTGGGWALWKVLRRIF